MVTLLAQVHDHAGESLWDRYVELVTDPAHLLLEITIILIIDVLIGALLWPLAKRWIKAHDFKHHGHACEDDHSSPVTGVIPEEHMIRLSPEAWDKFMEALDAPPKEIPKLKKLLSEPTVFDQDAEIR